MLTEGEKQKLISANKDLNEVKSQLNRLKDGFPNLNIIAPAKLGEGILKLSESELNHYKSVYENSDLDVVKFVPASGAATRMFNTLQEGLNKGEETTEVKIFANSINKLAFANSISNGLSPLKIVDFVLGEKGLNYSKLPKGLIQFHNYKKTVRTPFEEQLLEACLCATKKGAAKVHFTISKQYEEVIKSVHTKYRKDLKVRFDTEIEVEYSLQKQKTDTVAIDSNATLVKVDGKILFRPAGHGALIQNLNGIDTDLIFVKNIDNVVKESLIGDTVTYKKALAGKLIEVKNEIHNLLNSLLSNPSKETLGEALQFIKTTLGVDLIINATNLETKIQFAYRYLNRPIRVGGMVINTGELGGGPFWVEDKQFGKSLQIVEGVQINKNDAKQIEKLNASTHFNPVDLV
ncbi:MAG: DUF4301 family protein, partial [Flavobacteriales bacterium]|nr:DUF4301 family protein [Flavobacteriales bacterium]